MSVRLNITKPFLNSVLKAPVRSPTFNVGRSVISIRPTTGGRAVTKIQLSGSVLNSFKRAFSTNAEALNLTVEENGNVSTFKIAVPLPSDGKMLFSLKGDQSVKQFLANLKEEDATVNSASISTSDGTKISSTSQLNDVLRSSFKLTINNNTYTVTPVVASGATSLASVAVNGSAVSSNVDLDKLEVLQEKRREEKFNQLLKDFLPLYLEKQKHDKRASLTSNLIMWGGMGYLIAQWCVLARLTWWEFNWDIMEPVTYFITFGTGVLGYAYFAITKREYTYNDLRDSVKDKRRLSNYLSKGFDVEKYYVLEHKLRSLDGDALARVEVLAEEQKNQVEAPKA